ncbi:hypothetical protein CRM22_006330 [Opisthorchis felineus]|uniref:Uncharacterized protein n=1 Tax=Opisthorchis felineus TaxID=147828 RepID=A0A4S2LLJ8_OPIFE|nr:hypothetical protein CRM22_006330 [Opisthorchis felineus]
MNEVVFWGLILVAYIPSGLLTPVNNYTTKQPMGMYTNPPPKKEPSNYTNDTQKYSQNDAEKGTFFRLKVPRGLELYGHITPSLNIHLHQPPDADHKEFLRSLLYIHEDLSRARVKYEKQLKQPRSQDQAQPDRDSSKTMASKIKKVSAVEGETSTKKPPVKENPQIKQENFAYLMDDPPTYVDSEFDSFRPDPRLPRRPVPQYELLSTDERQRFFPHLYGLAVARAVASEE